MFFFSFLLDSVSTGDSTFDVSDANGELVTSCPVR